MRGEEGSMRHAVLGDVPEQSDALMRYISSISPILHIADGKRYEVMGHALPRMALISCEETGEGLRCPRIKLTFIVFTHYSHSCNTDPHPQTAAVPQE